MMRHSAIPLALALVLASASGGHAQQAKPEASPPAPQWQTQCDGAGQALDCRVTQTLVMQQTGQRLLTIIVRRPSKTEPPALMLHLPHGLFLPAGATIQIDKAKADSLVVQTCDEKGCYAGAPMPPAMLTAWQGAQTLAVTFQGLNKQPISVSVPLAGFADAYKALP